MENFRFWFVKRLLTTIILVKFVHGLKKKTIRIPWKGDASLTVFSSVFADENWKVASQACHFHQLPLSIELNTFVNEVFLFPLRLIHLRIVFSNGFLKQQ